MKADNNVVFAKNDDDNGGPSSHLRRRAASSQPLIMETTMDQPIDLTLTITLSERRADAYNAARTDQIQSFPKTPSDSS